MIDFLIEFIFKNVPEIKIGSLLMDLSSNGALISNYNCACDFKNINLSSEWTIRKLFSDNNDFGFFINLSEINRGKLSIKHCGIAVYKSCGVIDVEFNFQLSDLKNCKQSKISENLLELATAISEKYQVSQYLCGIEPAENLDTRLFTNKQLGPFFFKDPI